MKRADNCPLCSRMDTAVLKKYRFLPYEGTLNEWAELSYEKKRLAILSRYILKDTDAAEFEATLCRTCGLIFTNPRFTLEEIKIKYETLEELEPPEDLTLKNPDEKMQKRARRVFQLAMGFLENPDQRLRVLDYGGAEGYNLFPFIGDNDCFLLDWVEHEYPEGIRYLGGDLKSLDEGDKFDLIILCHVLEHVIEPSSIMEDLSAHLSEGGMIYVEVPLGCFREWRILREPLTHINFFSEESLSHCLMQAGFQILHLSTDYPLVRPRNMFSVKIIGKRSGLKTGEVPAFKSTRWQRRNLYYYLPLFIRIWSKIVGR